MTKNFLHSTTSATEGVYLNRDSEYKDVVLDNIFWLV